MLEPTLYQSQAPQHSLVAASCAVNCQNLAEFLKIFSKTQYFHGEIMLLIEISCSFRLLNLSHCPIKVIY